MWGGWGEGQGCLPLKPTDPPPPPPSLPPRPLVAQPPRVLLSVAAAEAVGDRQQWGQRPGEEAEAATLVAELAEDGAQLQGLVKRRLELRNRGKDAAEAAPRAAGRQAEMFSAATPCAARDIVARILEKVIKN